MEIKRLLFGKKKKKKSLKQKVLLTLVVPIAICFAFAFCWWLDDDWIMMSKIMFWNNKDIDGYVNLNGNAVKEASGSDGFKYGLGGSDATGLNLALVNQMAGGYMKDYLEIFRDHCNWKYVPSNLIYFKDADGNPTDEIMLNAMIGLNKAEYEPREVTINGVKVHVPSSMIDPERYDCISGYNFYTVTSKWFQDNGSEYNMAPTNKDRMQWGSPASDGGGTAHTTTFQNDMNYFALFPGGAIGPHNAYGYIRPSLLNTGYGITESEGQARGQDQIDAAYLPDWATTEVSSAYVRTFYDCYNADLMDRINDKYLATGAIHVGHHGAEREVRSLGVGAEGNNSASISSSSPSTKVEQIIDFFNMYTPILQKAITYFADHVDAGIDWNPHKRENWYGLGFGMFSGSYDIYFGSDTNRSTCLKKIKNNSDYREGVLLGIQIATGSTITAEELYSRINSTPLLSSLGGGYPVDLRALYSSGDFSFFFLSDQPANLIYANGNGSTVKAAHALGMNSAAWCFMDPIYGYFLIWDMLKASGVDCTFSDVAGGAGVLSAPGGLIDNIPSYELTNTTVGRRCAERMSQFAWTTRADGKATLGTALYIYVHYAVFGDDQYFRSCDRSVVTACRWAGADDTMSYSGCNDIIRYLLRNPDKWQLVTKGITNTVDFDYQPGDIAIASDLYSTGLNGTHHIVMHIGEELAQQYHPGADPTHTWCHGSYGTSSGRSPHLDTRQNCMHGPKNAEWHIFRRTGSYIGSKWVNILTDAEVQWFRDNPGYERWVSGWKMPSRPAKPNL